MLEEGSRTQRGERVVLDRAAGADQFEQANGNGRSAVALPAVADGGDALATAEAVPAAARLPLLRDAVFRRLLALADLAAAVGGLSLLGAATSRGVAAASLASTPLIVLMAKLAGRYDHDEVVLRKSTLDETPQLMVLAAAFALAWSAVAFVAGVQTELRSAGVVALWAAVATLLVLLRAGARTLAQVSSPPERALSLIHI